jgi:hypothetical protein
MHEHGGEKCDEISNGIGKKAAGNECPLHNKIITANHLHKEE